jgi:hypothetical protein
MDGAQALRLFDRQLLPAAINRGLTPDIVGGSRNLIAYFSAHWATRST